MELTPDQLAAARALGCAFSPATEHQVRRLTVQRRIFRIRGEPVVAARGGFLETWATLATLIGNHRPGAPEPGSETGATAAPEHAAQGDTGLLSDPVQPEVAEAEQNHPDAAAAAPRRPRPPRPTRAKSAPADAGAAPTGGTGARPSETEGMPAGGAVAQRRGPLARALWRKRTGWPPTPRWMVAGKMRRGRLK